MSTLTITLGLFDTELVDAMVAHNATSPGPFPQGAPAPALETWARATDEFERSRHAYRLILGGRLVSLAEEAAGERA